MKQEANSSLQSQTKAERRNFCCFRSSRLEPLGVAPAALVSVRSVGLFQITDLPFPTWEGIYSAHSPHEAAVEGSGCHTSDLAPRSWKACMFITVITVIFLRERNWISRVLPPKTLLGIGLATYFGACTSVLNASAEVLSSVIKIDSLVSCVSGFKSLTFNVNLLLYQANFLKHKAESSVVNPCNPT